MTYYLSPDAERDFDDIFSFGADRFSLPQAERYAQGMVSTFAFLSDYPYAARLRDEIVPPAHAYPYKAHLIIYDVTDERDVIIVRIRHGREDWFSSSPN